jgi:hypothetical protein
LDHTIFNCMGQFKIHCHSHSPVPFAGRYPFWIASFSDRYSPCLVFPEYRDPGFQYFPLFVLTQTSSVFAAESEGLGEATREMGGFGLT